VAAQLVIVEQSVMLINARKQTAEVAAAKKLLDYVWEGAAQRMSPTSTGRVGGIMLTIRMIAAVAALVAAIAPATAQNWPTRPVTIVYPFGAGSAGDVLGRIFASRLSELLGQPVLFENVGGAGGMTGASRVAKAAPDGYQVLLGTASTLAVNQTFYKHPLYNAMTDFAPVALIAESPIVLVARRDLPANNLQEFIAYAKASQAKMQYGSAGVGSAVHLACAGLNAAIGVNITHVPYRGGGSATQDLIAGRIDYQCPAAELAIPHIQGNSVKAIAVLTKNRSPILPNLASAHEQGLANFDAGAWFAFVLPKSTPAAIVQKLHNATVAAMSAPATEERLKEFGSVLVAPERRSPEYLQKFIQSEIDKWAALIKAANIKAQ
jgi:tripartite-type tricarboxylate transporter receptor subunit TctC